MAHNRRESVATGGGPYDQKCLQPAEEEIAVLCGLYKLVNGVKGTHTFGDKPNSPITIPQSFDEDEGRKESKKNTEMMVTSNQPATKRRKMQDDYGEVCEEQNAILIRIGDSLETLVAQKEKHAKKIEEINLQRLDVLKSMLFCMQKDNSKPES
ncbi:hypothetical protein ACLKA7_000219 [Drosophila subpalustris]